MKQITGTFQNPLGQPLGGALLYLKLSNDAVASGTGQIAPSLVSVKLDNTGSIPVNTNIWFNDELLPSGTIYNVSVVPAGGGVVWGPEAFSITGGSFNFNTATPTISGGGVVFSGVVVTNPVGGALQTIVGPLAATDFQSSLFTNSGGDVTLQETGDSFGTLNIHARNRSGTNGLVVENPGICLADAALQSTAVITAISINGSNVLTVTAAFGTVSGGLPSVGQIVTLTGLTSATFLNGQAVTIASVSSGQFTATFTHAAYGPASDTGIAAIQANVRAEFRSANVINSSNTSGEIQFKDPTTSTPWFFSGANRWGVAAQGTATALANFGAPSLTFGNSSWNGSSAVSQVIAYGSTPFSGANPGLAATILFPANALSPNNNELAIETLTPANSGANFNSPLLAIVGNSWSGSASQQEVANLQLLLGSGANPATTFQIAHSGGSGAFAVEVVGPLQLGSTDNGLSRGGASTVLVGNGTAGDHSGILGANKITDDGTGNFFRLLNSSQSEIMVWNGGTLGWSSASTAGGGSRDTGFQRLSAGVVGLGTGALGDFSGTLKTTVVNAVTGFQTNGSFGTAGQCLTTTGSASVWGNCVGGTPGLQINSTAVTVNTSTTASQALQSVSFAAGVFNAAGKAFNIQAAGSNLQAVNNTESITIFISFDGGSTLQSIASYTSPGVGGASWQVWGFCVVNSGATGFTCGLTYNWGSIPSQQIVLTTSTTKTQNLSNALTFEMLVSFTTASTSNTCTQSLFMVTPLN